MTLLSTLGNSVKLIKHYTTVLLTCLPTVRYEALGFTGYKSIVFEFSDTLLGELVFNYFNELVGPSNIFHF